MSKNSHCEDVEKTLKALEAKLGRVGYLYYSAQINQLRSLENHILSELQSVLASAGKMTQEDNGNI